MLHVGQSSWRLRRSFDPPRASGITWSMWSPSFNGCPAPRVRALSFLNLHQRSDVSRRECPTGTPLPAFAGFPVDADLIAIVLAITFTASALRFYVRDAPFRLADTNMFSVLSVPRTLTLTGGLRIGSASRLDLCQNFIPMSLPPALGFGRHLIGVVSLPLRYVGAAPLWICLPPCKFAGSICRFPFAPVLRATVIAGWRECVTRNRVLFKLRNSLDRSASFALLATIRVLSDSVGAWPALCRTMRSRLACL